MLQVIDYTAAVYTWQNKLKRGIGAFNTYIPTEDFDFNFST